LPRQQALLIAETFFVSYNKHSLFFSADGGSK